MTPRSTFDDRDYDRPIRFSEFVLGVVTYVGIVYVVIRVVTGLAS